MATDFAQQFCSLAERFTQIDDEAAVTEASARTFQCLWLADESGQLSLTAMGMDFSEFWLGVERWEQTNPTPYLREFGYASYWYSFVLQLPKCLPAELLPLNPNKSRDISTENGVTVSTTDGNWNLRADNYAYICSWLASQIGQEVVVDKPGSKRTAKATQTRMSKCERAKQLIKGYRDNSKSTGEITCLMREEHDDDRSQSAWRTFISRYKL